jgi:hypothetical protein
MNSFNFKSTNDDFRNSGIDFSKPVVVAVEPAQTGRGYNALIVQKMTNVPSSKEAVGGKPANAILAAVKQASFEAAGMDTQYYARTFQWYEEGKQPEVGEILSNNRLIVYDTTNPSDLDGITLKPENSIRQDKQGNQLTVGGKLVYRVHLLSKVSDNLPHTVLMVDTKEDKTFSEVKSTSKIS